MTPEIYNKIRRILFSTIHNPQKGFPVAFQYLEGYKKQLGIPSYTGLKAEMSFYEQFGQSYHLTVAGDMGEHADFAGIIEGTPTRIDVTTNIDYKQFKTYKTFMGDGYNYKIAFLDKSNFEIIDVLDLAFPVCTECGDSHIFPFAILLDQQFSIKGNPTLLYDQVLVELCPVCANLKEIERYSHYGLQSPSEYASEIPVDDQGDEQFFISEYNNYTEMQYQFMKKLFDIELMGICENRYEIINPTDGDGYWGLGFPLINNILKDKIEDIIPTGRIE